jgi:hypothetical protein
MTHIMLVFNYESTNSFPIIAAPKVSRRLPQVERMIDWKYSYDKLHVRKMNLLNSPKAAIFKVIQARKL